jgi:hypothetical protein
MKAFRQYKQVRNAWTHNFELAKENPAAYFISISQYLRKHNPRYFRWHAAGDILNQNYLNSMVSLANNYPSTNFPCFTKRHDLDYSAIPLNLQIIFSMWKGFGDNKKDIRRAWMLDHDRLDTRIPDKYIKCPGSCENCKTCFETNSTKLDVVFEKH